VKGISMLDVPPRMNELWEWVNAIYAYDFGDREPIAELVKAGEIPKEFRLTVANIIAGTREPNYKAGAKLKIPAREGMKVAGTVATNLGLCDAVKKNAKWITENNPRFFSVDAIEIVRSLEGEARKIVSDAARDLRVSEDTIISLLQEMARRVDRWPVV
jgi:hypothetical protein